MSRKYITSQTLNTVTDSVTGEIIESVESKTFRIETPSERFYSVFCEMFKLGLTGRDRDVLDYLCVNSSFDKGYVDLGRKARKEMSEALDMSPQFLSNVFKKLKDKEIITIDEDRIYINPELFWKGNLKVRDAIIKGKNIKLKVEVSLDEEA
jgi:hypothetical protein